MERVGDLPVAGLGMPVPDQHHPRLTPGFEASASPKALRLFCLHPSVYKGFYTDPRAFHGDVFGHMQDDDLWSGSPCPVAWCWLGPCSLGLGCRALDRISSICRNVNYSLFHHLV